MSYILGICLTLQAVWCYELGTANSYPDSVLDILHPDLDKDLDPYKYLISTSASGSIKKYVDPNAGNTHVEYKMGLLDPHNIKFKFSNII